MGAVRSSETLVLNHNTKHAQQLREKQILLVISMEEVLELSFLF